MLTPRLQRFLDENQVKYRTVPHTAAYTAQEVAALSHVSGKELVKAVIVKIDGKLAMFIEPANHRINLKELGKRLGAKKVELATESEFADWFPECELGAMPPFGNLYNMNVLMEEDSLAENEKIAFNAGSHEDLVEMAFKDFEKLVKPQRVRMH